MMKKTKMLTSMAVFVIVTILFATLTATAFADDGQISNQENDASEYTIYTSIEEAEADIGETETKSVAPSATMTPVFIRSGNTTKV